MKVFLFIAMVFAFVNADVVKEQKVNCKNNKSESCVFLAKAYNAGIVVKQNHSRSEFFYKKACALSNNKACYQLSLRHKEGVGKPKDEVRYRLYMKKACDLGNEDACKELSE